MWEVTIVKKVAGKVGEKCLIIKNATDPGMYDRPCIPHDIRVFPILYYIHSIRKIRQIQQEPVKHD